MPPLPDQITEVTSPKEGNYYWIAIEDLNDPLTIPLSGAAILDPTNWQAGIAEKKLFISWRYSSIVNAIADPAENTLANADTEYNPLTPTTWTCVRSNPGKNTHKVMKDEVGALSGVGIYLVGEDHIKGLADPNDPNGILPIPLANAPQTTDIQHTGQTGKEEARTFFKTNPNWNLRVITGTMAIKPVLP